MHIRTWQFWIILGACLHSFGEVFCAMGKKYHCWVGGSNNDQRYPDLVGKRSYVSELIWHRWLKGEPYESFWENAYRKGTKISSRSVHNSMFEPLRGSGPNRSNIPFPLESDGTLIGLQQKAQVSYPIRRCTTWRCFGRWRRNFRGLYLSLI